MATPTGGVIEPSVTMVIINMPKWTGSKPMLWMIGTKIGVSIRRREVENAQECIL